MAGVGVQSVDYLSDDDHSSSRGGRGGGFDNSSHTGGGGGGDSVKDGQSSVSGHGTSGASTAGSDSNNEKLFGGNRLTRNVKGSKMAVLALLFLVTIGVCLAVYFITSNGEEAEFQTT